MTKSPERRIDGKEEGWGMKRSVTIVGRLAILGLLTIPTGGRAEDVAGDLAKKIDDLQTAVKSSFGGLKVSGYLEGSYSWSSATSVATTTTTNPDGTTTTTTSPNRVITGRSFDREDSQFMFNAFQLQIQRPVATDKWDAGFSSKLFFGQNATLIQSAGLSLGNQGDLEEGYVTLNVPVGNGLQFKAGKWVTLMGVEVIEDTVNPTWSEGNQFLYAENFTGTGLEVDYKWNDLFDSEVRVYNGWDVVQDNNTAKSLMGRFGITPDSTSNIGIVAYGGPEEASNSHAWRKGVNVVAQKKFTDAFNTWLQFDYGSEDANSALPNPNKDAKWWAVGGWAAYDFAPEWGLGFRADYFDDEDGARTSNAPFTAPYPLNTKNKIETLTMTVNCREWTNVLVRPEIRYDHSSVHNAYGDSKDQVSLGISTAYLF